MHLTKYNEKHTFTRPDGHTAVIVRLGLDVEHYELDTQRRQIGHDSNSCLESEVRRYINDVSADYVADGFALAEIDGDPWDGIEDLDGPDHRHIFPDVATPDGALSPLAPCWCGALPKQEPTP